MAASVAREAWAALDGSDNAAMLMMVVGLDGLAGRQGQAPTDGAVALAGFAARLGFSHLGPTRALALAAKGRLVAALDGPGAMPPGLLTAFIAKEA